MTRKFSPLNILLPIALAIFVLWLYLPSVGIPLLYAEREGISNNRVVYDMNRYYNDILTPLGMVNRPLSVFTYTITYAFVKDAPAVYHYTNMVIQALNVILIFFLARTFACSPLLAALIFATHPLGTAVAGQIFGRNYSLATMFLLLGYLLYRRKVCVGEKVSLLRWIWIALFVTLGILSKQVMVIAPVLFLWDEFHRSKLSIVDLYLRVKSRRLYLILSLLLAVSIFSVAAAFVIFYAIPLSATSPVNPFTYFFSQLGNVHNLLRFVFLPYQTSLLHDLYFYRTPWHFEVLFGFCVLAISIFAALKYRHSQYAFFLGAFILFIVPTNSFLPKNEIIREWRLYCSLVFFCLAMGAIPISLAKLQWKHATSLAAAVIVALYCLVGLNIDTVRRQLIHYQTRPSTWAQMAKAYPYSADAYNNWGKAVGEKGRDKEALELFKKATELGKEVYVYPKNVTIALRRLGLRSELPAYEKMVKEREKKYGKKSLSIYFKEDINAERKEKEALAHKKVKRPQTKSKASP